MKCVEASTGTVELLRALYKDTYITISISCYSYQLQFRIYTRKSLCQINQITVANYIHFWLHACITCLATSSYFSRVYRVLLLGPLNYVTNLIKGGGFVLASQLHFLLCVGILEAPWGVKSLYSGLYKT